jgi:hypothetical protein
MKVQLRSYLRKMCLVVFSFTAGDIVNLHFATVIKDHMATSLIAVIENVIVGTVIVRSVL